MCLEWQFRDKLKRNYVNLQCVLILIAGFRLVFYLARSTLKKSVREGGKGGGKIRALH